MENIPPIIFVVKGSLQGRRAWRIGWTHTETHTHTYVQNVHTHPETYTLSAQKVLVYCN